MRLGLCIVMCLLASSSGSSQGVSRTGCAPSREAIARLRGYLAYYYGVDQDFDRKTQKFDVLLVNGREYFRSQDAEPIADPKERWVYIYQAGADWKVITCPAIDTWKSCEADLLAGTPPEGVARRIYRQAAANAGSCHIATDVPRWSPSPDGPEKRRLAREILQSLQVGSDAKAVYAKDFNVLDPQIFLMVEIEDGEHEFYRCRVVTGKGSRCELGGFGTVSKEDLERVISAHAFQIYPEPK